MKRRYEPRQLVIEVTNACNLNCLGCPSASGTGIEDYGRGFMSFDFFKSIIDRIDFETTVVLWLNGEPLLHPRYAEMAAYVSERKHRWYVTTNGHIWDKRTFEHIVGPDSTCYQVLFSLDGLFDPRSKSIEVARPGSSRDITWDVIHRFIELRNQAQPDPERRSVDVAVKLCERGQDTEEIENYVAWWLSQGIDYVAVGRMLTQENPKSMRMYPCRYFWDTAMEIRYDGTVIPCSYNVKVANEHALDMGVLDKETPLLDFYNNEEYRRLRLEHARGVFRGPCRTCGFAYCGDGFDGVIQFRNEHLQEEVLDGKPIYWHSDYYNQFFSLRKKRKGISYMRSWQATIGKDVEELRRGDVFE